MAKSLLMIPIKYQPIVAMIFPVIKEFNTRVYGKLIARASNGDASGAKLVVQYIVGTKHTIMLCFIMGTMTSDVTNWVLMGIDFVENTCMCLRIVWLTKRNRIDANKQIYLIQALAINEVVEFVSPLAFILTFLGAFYGPNSVLLGNVGSDLWHFKPVEDIEGYLSTIMIFFFIDFSSVVLSSIILWLSCRINLVKAFMAIEKEFRLIISLIITFHIVLVRDHLCYLKFF